MFWFGLIAGALGAGTLMYYYQPQIKLAVAQVFGSEAKLVATYDELQAKAKAVLAAAKSRTGE